MQEIRTRRIPTILGNHELAVIKNEYLKWFNPVARRSLVKTCELLSAQSLEFIAGLENFRTFHGCRCVHGFPPDSCLIYGFQVSEASKIRTLADTPERLCFIGHTHVLEMIRYDGETLHQQDLAEGTVTLDPQSKYIINIGSVGQPRDGNNKAKYVIWDTEADTVEVRYVAYDIAAVAEKIKEAGLPEEHALRLW